MGVIEILGESTNPAFFALTENGSAEKIGIRKVPSAEVVAVVVPMRRVELELCSQTGLNEESKANSSTVIVVVPGAPGVDGVAEILSGRTPSVIKRFSPSVNSYLLSAICP